MMAWIEMGSVTSETGGRSAELRASIFRQVQTSRRRLAMTHRHGRNIKAQTNRLK